MSGSATGGGINFQAFATAYVGVHVLARRELGWQSGTPHGCPTAVVAETGGAGDDIAVEIDGAHCFEVQVKRGLRAGDDFWEAILKLVHFVAGDPARYGALVVDQSTSGTIRTGFRRDLRRLAEGRTDGLKETAATLLRRLEQLKLDPAVVATRLSVVVLDEAELRYLLFVLGRCVGESAADHAWSVIRQDALDLIDLRGRRDANGLERLLEEQGISLIADHTSSPDLYRDWARSTTESFTVPGLGVTLPIDAAAFRVRLLAEGSAPYSADTLEEWLRSYREWERHAAEYSRDGVDVEHFDQLPQRLVIVGGPGSGKSTLLRKLAHHACEQQRTALVLRAPVAVRYMLSGSSFDEALVKAATEGIGGFDISPSVDPAVLFIDGLDECNQRQAQFCSALLKWVRAHTSVRLVVSTRPIGHDPSLLPGWDHADLLPLDSDRIERFAETVLRALGHATGGREFRRRIADGQAAKLAARNPLLLGFLLALYVDGEGLTDSRAVLLERIIERLRTHPIHDRELSDQVSPGVARTVIHSVGWQLLTDPQIPRSQIASAIASALAGGKKASLREIENADEAIAMWEDRRLLEALHIGGEDLLAFVHLSLGEFAAACELSRFTSDDAKRWLIQIRLSARWREVIILTAARNSDLGRQILLWLSELDDPADPASTEALLASAIVLEARLIDRDLVTPVIAGLSRRVESHIPEVAFDAHRALVSLAGSVPDLVAPVASKLLESPQFWTKEAAIHVCLACGPGHFDPDLVHRLIESFVTGAPSFASASGHIFADIGEQNLRGDIVDKFLHALVQTSDDGRLEALAALLAENLDTTSVSIWEAVVTGCRRLGRDTIADRLDDVYRERFGARDGGFDLEAHKRADRIALEAMIRVCPSPESKSSPSPKIPNVGVVLNVMDWMSAPAFSWERMADVSDSELLDATFSGAIDAANVSRADVGAEAAWALANLDGLYDFGTGHYGMGLFEYVPRLDADANWKRAAERAKSAEPLLRALLVRVEPISRCAAEMLAAGVGGELVDRFLLAALHRDEASLLRLVGPVCAVRWDKRALTVLADRLQAPASRGSAFLLLPLAMLMEPSPTTAQLEPFLRALQSEDTRIATAAAEALTHFKRLPSDILVRLDSALDRRWPLSEPAGPNSSHLLDTPGPPLFTTLRRAGALSRPRLHTLVDHWDSRVRAVALEEFLKAATREELCSLIARAAAGDDWKLLLKGILAISDDRLIPVASDLSRLLSAMDPAIRLRMLEELTTARWLDGDTARSLARTATNDPDLEIRSKAVRVLRQLQ